MRLEKKESFPWSMDRRGFGQGQRSFPFLLPDTRQLSNYLRGSHSELP